MDNLLGSEISLPSVIMEDEVNSSRSEWSVDDVTHKQKREVSAGIGVNSPGCGARSMAITPVQVPVLVAEAEQMQLKTDIDRRTS